MQPSDALSALSIHLEGYGLTRMYSASQGRLGVLSVAPGVTVWCCDGKVLIWRTGGTEIRLPAADPAYAARQLAELMTHQPS